MILNNYWAYKQYMEKTAPQLGSDTYIDIPGCISVEGPQYSNVVVGYNSTRIDNDAFKGITENRSLRYKLYSKVGSSDAAPTALDTDLNEDITSSFDNYTTEVRVNSSGDQMVTTIEFGGDNNTGSEITIRELGIYKSVHNTVPYDGTEYLYHFMFVHHVLEEPIVVPVGQGFTKVFEWREG